MEKSSWTPVCKWCGKRLPMKIVEKNGLTPPSVTPREFYHDLTYTGCHESSNGWHTYMWERSY